MFTNIVSQQRLVCESNHTSVQLGLCEDNLSNTCVISTSLLRQSNCYIDDVFAKTITI